MVTDEWRCGNATRYWSTRGKTCSSTTFSTKSRTGIGLGSMRCRRIRAWAMARTVKKFAWRLHLWPSVCELKSAVIQLDRFFEHFIWKVKESYPYAGLDRPLELLKVQVSKISKQSVKVGGARLSALRTGRLYPPPPRRYPWYLFQSDAESTSGP
jgi:hypothetical protein